MVPSSRYTIKGSLNAKDLPKTVKQGMFSQAYRDGDYDLGNVPQLRAFGRSG